MQPLRDYVGAAGLAWWHWLVRSSSAPELSGQPASWGPRTAHIDALLSSTLKQDCACSHTATLSPCTLSTRFCRRHRCCEGEPDVLDQPPSGGGPQPEGGPEASSTQRVLLSGSKDGSLAAWQLPGLELLLRLSLHLGAVRGRAHQTLWLWASDVAGQHLLHAHRSLAERLQPVHAALHSHAKAWHGRQQHRSLSLRVAV